MPAPSEKGGVVDRTITLYGGMRARVLRFYLPSGVLETLITNEFTLDKTAFKMLYFLRWPVEEKCKLIKEKSVLNKFQWFLRKLGQAGVLDFHASRKSRHAGKKRNRRNH